jgi:hypothetical protein
LIKFCFRNKSFQQSQYLQQQQQQNLYHQQLLYQQQQQQLCQNRLSPNCSNSSNQSSASSASSEYEDQSPKFNFRALLRKTGQDLTNGSTLSRKRAQIETRQVDFRNVLRNRTKPQMDQVKLIQRLVSSH